MIFSESPEEAAVVNRSLPSPGAAFRISHCVDVKHGQARVDGRFGMCHVPP